MAFEYGYTREEVLKLTRLEVFQMIWARRDRIDGGRPAQMKVDFTEEQKNKIDDLLKRNEGKSFKDRRA